MPRFTVMIAPAQGHVTCYIWKVLRHGTHGMRRTDQQVVHVPLPVEGSHWLEDVLRDAAYQLSLSPDKRWLPRP